jgi:Tol biopolymer transport system component
MREPETMYRILSLIAILTIFLQGARAEQLNYDETHLQNITQLSFGGQNAEAYFSHDGSELIFQSTRDELGCDAIFRMNIDGSNVRRISSGAGVTTCSFIAPDNQSVIYASTHLGGNACPPRPDYSRGYVWPLYPDYDIFKAGPEGGNLQRLTDTPGYDAEGVFSPQGDKILFTSIRSGDLELYLMNPDGSGVEQLTDAPGYDGGGFFSLDGKSIVWRASRPSGQALEEYNSMIKFLEFDKIDKSGVAESTASAPDSALPKRSRH